MSDDSDFGSANRRKRNAARRVEDSPESSSSSSDSPVLASSKRKPRFVIGDDSESDGSSIGASTKRKRVARVSSDEDSDSSGSVIIQRTRRPARVVSDSSDDSDHGFQGSSSSQWETDCSDTETAKPSTAKIQDTGVDSDSSDGQSEKCPICLLSFTTQEVGTPETCEHVFCVECIQEWSKNMNTCPVDRQEYQTILVRKRLNGKVYKHISIQPPQMAPEPDEDPTFCEICGSFDREDRMLLCDGCDLGFHLECLTPPLQDVPEGAWFCQDCSPEDVVDPDIQLYELQLLLDDVHDMERPTQRRRAATRRLIPRTRQTERVIRQIANNRRVERAAPETSSSIPDTTQTVSSTTRRRTVKRRKKRRVRYRTVYEVDPTTGETVAVKKRRKTKKHKRTRAPQPPKTVKKRLALQLGICAPRDVPQNLPDVRIPQPANSIGTQRYMAGIPSLHLFGQRDELDLFSPSEDEGDGGLGVLVRRAPNRMDVAALRRNRTKTLTITNPVSSTSDVLGSILETQAKFHSKDAVLSLGKNGKIEVESDRNRVRLNNYGQFIRRRPLSYSNNSANDSVPSSSGNRSDCQSSSSPDYSNSTPTSTVETSNPTSNRTSGNSDERYNVPQDYTQRNLLSIYEANTESSKKDKKPRKSGDQSENNSPRTGTPCSESEVDIYSDIETVSTSKVDETDFKVPSPAIHTPNTGTDEDNNDSEPDMVIDTDKVMVETEESGKEEAAVTSTVDSNNESASIPPTVTSTSDIQSGAVQSSSHLFDDKPDKDEDDNEDSEDGCPNFSIYSKESITMAKNTDISLAPDETSNHGNDQVEEISSSPVVDKQNDQIENAQDEQDEEVENLLEAPLKKKSNTGGLYSDSEDETIVKKDVGNSFGISDIRNMTEDISEEERSYTPCLDERGPTFRQGLEGLDTEMISDEDRNDFDESHDLKTASDGDALEINAKESEMDFTRPEDYEEGEIVDKLKNKKTADDAKKTVKDDGKKGKKKDEGDKVSNKENENQNKEATFKKLSKNTKERNYRDKDRERSKSHEKKDKSEKESKKDKKKEKRKEIERYDVRALIAEKPRRLKDKFGRDIRRSTSNSRSRSVTPRRSPSRSRRSLSKSRRSLSKSRRSLSKTRRSLSRERGRKKRRRSKNRRSVSRSKSRSAERRRSRSKTKKRRHSVSRERRRKSRERSKGKKKPRSRSRHRSRSPSPKRTKDWGRRRSREWTPSLSRSRSPEPRHMTPSWTPPRIMDNTVKPHNLTVILTNNANKKKKEKKRKADKKAKENERQKKRKRSERTPPPSKEVFASGDNILVSVSFNKESETRDVSTTKRKREVEEVVSKKPKKDKRPKKVKKTKDLSGVKPVAIIDLERSPFKELTPSPKDIIVLSDSDNEDTRNLQKGICDSSQQVASPERCGNNYSTGPKTPPEPQVKFTLTSKQPQMRAISNPLHDPEDIEPEGDTQEVNDNLHKGPNTPPEPPNSPPTSPDAYDPFEPTKSRSPTPEPMQTTQSNSTSNLDDNRDDSILETRSGMSEIIEKSNNSVSQTPDALKSHTPPLADIQPADSQSSIHATPESSLGKSPDRSSNSLINQSAQTQPMITVKPIAQTIPFSSVSTSMTSTPVSSNLTSSRISILNTTIITPPTSIPQRIVLPNSVKSSPVKISPTKTTIKSTPIKPMPAKTTATKAARKSSSRNQNGSDTVDASLSFDSPYSPGSSDYEDLFEPPVESVSKPPAKPQPPTSKATKSPTKIQHAFDALFGSPFNKNLKPKADNKTKYTKKSAVPVASKGTKQVGVKVDEDNLKILDELPNSAVEMQVKDKFLKKLNRQERVVEEVKLVLKPHYNKKHINKEEYKDILRRAVPKICHNKTGEINPTKIKNLIEAYVKKVRHSKKVTSSSSVNQKT